MIIMFFAAIMGIMIINLSYISSSFQGLNRAIIFAPIEIMYKDLKMVNDTLLFNVSKIENNMNEYYAKSLPKYCSSYTVEYFFYNEEDSGVCLDESCRGFEVTIRAEIVFSLVYERTMNYKVEGF